MRFLADEGFNNRILRGVLLKNADFDVIRVQDTEVYEADDPTVLTWAAKEGRILLTHDVKTMTHYAMSVSMLGYPCPAVIEIHQQVPVGEAITALLTLIGASDAAAALSGERCRL